MNSTSGKTARFTRGAKNTRNGRIGAAALPILFEMTGPAAVLITLVLIFG